MDNCKVLSILVLLFFGLQVFARKNAINPISGTIEVNVIPSKKDAQFNGNQVKYSVVIQNNYSENQEGSVYIVVKNDKSDKIISGTYEVKIDQNKSTTIVTEFPIKKPGIYEYWVYVSLSEYEDTLRNVFAYKIKNFQTPLNKPIDFDAFWLDAKNELSKINPEYSISLVDSLTTKSHSVYYVEMTSWNKVRINAWLSVPRIAGRFPVLIGLPGYRKTLNAQLADEMASFQLNIRNHKSNNEPYTNAEYEFALFNLEDKYNYIYKGAYLDCVRAIDFLFWVKGLRIDTSRIVVGGGSQGGALALVASALDNRIKACVADNPIFCDFHNLVAISEKQPKLEWPVNRFKDFMFKSGLGSMKDIINTLDYYDPQNFASKIGCPVMIGVGLLDHLAPPSCIYAFYNKLDQSISQKSEIHSFPNLAHEVSSHHRKYENQWLSEHVLHPKRIFYSN